MESILDYINPVLLTESSCQKLDVLDSCYAALSEGVYDTEVIMTTASYTQSFVFEVLENVKDALLKLYQQVLSVLQNFILNTANLADKYRNLLIDRFIAMREPFVFKTYEYPKLQDKNYPAIFKSSVSVEQEVQELQSKIIDKGITGSEVEDEIHRLLKQFGRAVLDDEIIPDDLNNSVISSVNRHVRGKEVTRRLTQRDINAFIDEICKHKEFRDDLARTKNNLIDDYTKLKQTYTRTLKDKEAELLGIRAMKYPELERLKMSERDRFASINLAMTRLFDGYISVYREAFNQKLSIMQDKVEDNRRILVELMTRTNVLTTLSTKTPDRNRRPIVFNPGIKT